MTVTDPAATTPAPDLSTPAEVLAELQRLSAARATDEDAARSLDPAERAQWRARRTANYDREVKCWQAALDLAAGGAELPRKLVLYALVDARGARSELADRMRSQLADDTR